MGSFTYQTIVIMLIGAFQYESTFSDEKAWYGV